MSSTKNRPGKINTRTRATDVATGGSTSTSYASSVSSVGHTITASYLCFCTYLIVFIMFNMYIGARGYCTVGLREGGGQFQTGSFD